MSSSGGGPGGSRSPGYDRMGRLSRYRVELPNARIVENEDGQFEATEFAEQRVGLKGKWLGVRDRVLGTTISSRHLEDERLSKVKALAIFSSDALSSVAYATQEIMFVLVLAGAGALKFSFPIAIAITLLLAITIASYRQTVRAYPSGGGAYIVALDNLGLWAGLVAGASLLIDYVLTVSVSVAAGMDALASLNEGFRPYAVVVAVVIVAIVAIINLRGVTESGTIFAIPTYAFVGILGTAIVVVLFKVILNGENPLGANAPDPKAVDDALAKAGLSKSEAVTIFLVLRAFANGCTALTGVEAISNGVQAFKQPASKNASTTLLAMGLILGSMFMGVTLVARHYGFVPDENNTIPAQLGAKAFGEGSPLFGFLQLMTAGILVLAANTSFNGFPRLAAILARDGYMPRILQARGNRLAFSYGIVVLAILACILLVAFDAKTTKLIPLYALGVFLSFTLSQFGMVLHWRKDRGPGWRRAAVVNGLGSLATLVVLGVILEAKFLEGAWVVVVLIPIMAGLSYIIGSFYKGLARGLHVPVEAQLDLKPRGRSVIPILVPVEDLNLATVMALGAACEQSREVVALHVQFDPDAPSTVATRWRRQVPDIPLVVIDSPYRTVTDPIAAYINDRLHHAPYQVTVMIPVLEVKHWYQRPLVNQSLKPLKRMLANDRHVDVVSFPFSPGSPGRAAKSVS